MPRRAILELEQKALESLPGASGTITPSFINEKKEVPYTLNAINAIWNDSAEIPNSVTFLNGYLLLRQKP